MRRFGLGDAITGDEERPVPGQDLARALVEALARRLPGCSRSDLLPRVAAALEKASGTSGEGSLAEAQAFRRRLAALSERVQRCPKTTRTLWVDTDSFSAASSATSLSGRADRIPAPRRVGLLRRPRAAGPRGRSGG